MSDQALDQATLAAIVASCKSAYELASDGDVEGAAHALARADKRLQELIARNQPHARVVRKAHEAIQKSLTVAMTKDPHLRARLARRAERTCARAY